MWIIDYRTDPDGDHANNEDAWDLFNHGFEWAKTRREAVLKIRAWVERNELTPSDLEASLDNLRRIKTPQTSRAWIAHLNRYGSHPMLGPTSFSDDR